MLNLVSFKAIDAMVKKWLLFFFNIVAKEESFYSKMFGCFYSLSLKDAFLEKQLD